MSASVSTSIEHSGTVVLTVRGTVEHATITPLCDTINHLIEQQRPALVHVDLQFVTYIDATAVGALDACRRSPHRRDERAATQRERLRRPDTADVRDVRRTRPLSTLPTFTEPRG